MSKLKNASELFSKTIFKTYSTRINKNNCCDIVDTKDNLTVIALTSTRDMHILQFVRSTSPTRDTTDKDVRSIMLCPGSGDKIDIHTLRTSDPTLFQEEVFNHLIERKKTKPIHDKDGFIMMEYAPDFVPCHNGRPRRIIRKPVRPVEWEIIVYVPGTKDVDDMAASICSMFVINEYPCTIDRSGLYAEYDCTGMSIQHFQYYGYTPKDYMKFAVEIEEYLNDDMHFNIENEMLSSIIAKLINLVTPIEHPKQDMYDPFIEKY